MAVPTPMIFPVPMVEARAVTRAPNWLTSPSESGSGVKDSRMAVPIFFWMPPVMTVIRRWVPKSRTIMGHPQIAASTALMPFMIVCAIFSIFVPLFFFCQVFRFS